MPPAAALQPPTAAPWDWQPAEPSLLIQPVSLLRLEGADTRRFLHGQTSQAIEAAAAGEWLRSCCIGPTARMKALVEVLIDAEGAWLVITAGDGQAVHQALDRVLFPADAVRLQQPRPGRLCTPLGPERPQPAVPAGRWQRAAEVQGWWLGDSLLLVDGAELPAALAGRRPLSSGEAERWRIQQGLPASPAELNDDTNPFELGLAARVSLSKGCYVGQETLARLATYDGVKQQLRRWLAQSADGEAASAPAVGQELRDAAGERAGRISSVLALGDGLWIGLALVRRAQLQAASLQLADSDLNLWLSPPAEWVAPPQGAGAGGRP